LNGYTLSGVEPSELDARMVSGYGHLPSDCINLFDQVALGQPSNGRITAHGSNVVKIDGKDQGGMPHTGCCKCSLASRMTRTNHDYIIFFVEGRHDGIIKPLLLKQVDFSYD
jgi:hypothetical protein